jgi:hypothetical protein
MKSSSMPLSFLCGDICVNGPEFLRDRLPLLRQNSPLVHEIDLIRDDKERGHLLCTLLHFFRPGLHVLKRMVVDHGKD